jgi:hypothetical protein
LIPAAIWLAGLAGFLIPLQLARTSQHAELLRTIAMGWLLIFGAINAYLALRAPPAHRRDIDGKDNPFTR